ncbi:MAG: YciI family protein [Actinomycetota bacterium]
MKYLMLVCYDPSLAAETAEPETAADAGSADSGGDSGGDDSFPWLDEMTARGIRLDGDRLKPPAEGRTVRVRHGEVLLADGPFAETKEVIVGYDVIECADLDEAVAVAAAHPVAQSGAIEVRPFWK